MLAIVCLTMALLTASLAHSADVSRNLRWNIGDRSADVQSYQVYKSASTDWQIMEPFGAPILITGDEYKDKVEIIHQVTFTVPDKEDHIVFFSVRAIDTSGNPSNYAKDNAGNTVFVGFRFMNEPPAPPTGMGDAGN